MKPLAVYLAVFGLISCSPAPIPTAAPETPRFTKENWPRSLQSAVQIIVTSLSDANKATLRQTPKSELIKYHFGWGMGIRNDFGLWGGNQDLLLSACGKPCHPDDASMLIIEGVWSELQKTK